jgi:hypothetical protein
MRSSESAALAGAGAGAGSGCGAGVDPPGGGATAASARAVPLAPATAAAQIVLRSVSRLRVIDHCSVVRLATIGTSRAAAEEPAAARIALLFPQPVNRGRTTLRAAQRARVLRNVAVGVLLAAVKATRIARWCAEPDRTLTRTVNVLPEVGLRSVLIARPSSVNVTEAIDVPRTDAR